MRKRWGALNRADLERALRRWLATKHPSILIWHFGVKVSEHAIRRDFLLDGFECRFIQHNGLYDINVNPLGQCNAPATFDRLIHGIFRKQIGKVLASYLDDFLMNAQRNAGMVHILDRTLGQLIDAGLKCKPWKWELFPDSIPYLGHLIKEGKIGADRSNREKIREWPFPPTVNEMSSFLGLCNYYLRLIPHFEWSSEPLYKPC